MRYQDLRVDDLMSTALITVHPHQTVDDADYHMQLADIRHIPVVDERNRLQGILSNRDLLVALNKARGRSVRIRDVMTTRVHTISAEAPACEAVEKLIEFKIGCLPVIGDEGQLVGIVTESDLLQVAYRVMAGKRTAAHEQQLL